MGLLDRLTQRSVVGLDIGTWGIKAALLKHSARGYQVQTMGMEPLPPEVVVDGTIMDAAVVVEKIGNLYERAGIRSKQVVLGVSGTSVIVKKIQVDRRSDQELKESIYWEAEEYIPFDIEDVSIDYEILPETEESDPALMDLILVAVKREKVNDYVSIVQQAGLEAVVVDVDGFALQNCFEANYDANPGEVVALVDIGAAVMNINILQSGVHVMYRDISIGGNNYSEAMQRELNVSSEQAEELKRGESIDGVSQQDVAGILDQVTRDLVREIQRSFDYFRNSTGIQKVDRIYLTGGATQIEGIDKFFALSLETNVTPLDPFRRIDCPSTYAGVPREEWAAFMPVALGLAMRRPGDK